jgi:hypothetical protein
LSFLSPSLLLRLATHCNIFKMRPSHADGPRRLLASSCTFCRA